MEVIFVNRYIRDKQLLKELYGYLYFRRATIIVCNIILALAFAASLLAAIFEGDGNLGVLIFVPLVYLFQIARYVGTVNTVMKRDLEVHGKAIHCETVITDDHIQSTASTGAVHQLNFAGIKKAYQTKNLILLYSKANLIYIFRKDTFTKGSKEEFLAFLQRKGIKL